CQCLRGGAFGGLGGEFACCFLLFGGRLGLLLGLLGGVGGGAFRGFAFALLALLTLAPLLVRSCSWRLISSAWRRASSSRRASSALSCSGAVSGTSGAASDAEAASSTSSR